MNSIMTQLRAMLRADESSAEQRRHGRLEQEHLVSNIGVVLDLSAGGVRISCRVAPKVDSTMGVTLKGPGGSLTLRARTVWASRRGLFRQEAGLEFVDVTPEVRRQLTALALTHRERRVI